MSVAYTAIKGIVFCNYKRTYNGVTLFTPMDGTTVWLTDMLGRVVHHWDMGYKPGCYGELLPNGNLLYAGKVENGPLADLDGAGGILLEVDWDGNVVWEYKDPYLHHAFYRIKNGNTLALKWVKVPDQIAAKVKGGEPGTEKEGVMWGDAIQEIRTDGKVAWEWIAHEHLDPEVDLNCLICPRSTWSHANSVVELPDGNILISFMKINNIAIIEKKTGKIMWRWKPYELGHQHSASILDNGNILVFDNGLHTPNATPLGFSRILEINPSTSEVVWSYIEMDRPKTYFYSPTMSNCQRLPNGNTLICEGIWGRLFEVTPKSEVVWEYVNNLPSHETSPTKSKPCSVYCAYRYGMDYSGLKRPILIPQERQPAPGTAGAKPEEALKARLARLGY